MRASVQSNIWKMYVIKAFRWFMVAMPIIVLFYQENGLSIREVFILQSVFSVVIVLSEMPSGYFSDVFGRKLSIILGSIFGFLGFLIYSFSFGFAGFLLAEIILGIGSGFISGADSALLYDSLIETEQEQSYKKFEGRVLSVAHFSEGLAGILGGFLALISLRIPVYAETAAMFLAIPFAFTLVEPKRHVPDPSAGNIKAMIKILKYSLNDHLEVKWLILYSSLISTATLTATWLIQPYFRLVGLPLPLFGILWAALYFFLGVSSFSAAGVEALLGRRRSLLSLVIILAAPLVLLGIFPALWAIAFFFVIYFMRGLHLPVLKDYINRLIGSETRATILSISALTARLLFAVIGPIVGWISDLYSLRTALIFAGCLFLALGSLVLLKLHKYRLL